MKIIFTALVLLLMSWQANSQTCNPNLMYADSSAGVYPLPYNELTNPMGGIPDTACINQYFEFALTAVIPDMINVGSFDVEVTSLTLDNIMGLPSGLSYLCSPEDCVYPANSIGCILIYGTPDETNTESVYDVLVDATANTSFGPFALTFPGLLGAGNYFLYLNSEDDCNLDANENIQLANSISVFPNPNSGTFTIDMPESIKAFEYGIYNSIGERIEEGDKADGQFSLTHFVQGVYFIKLKIDEQIVVKKILVTK